MSSKKEELEQVVNDLLHNAPDWWNGYNSLEDWTNAIKSAARMIQQIEDKYDVK